MASFSYPWARGNTVQLSLVWFDFQLKTSQTLRQSAARSSSHFNLHFLFRAILIGFCYCTVVAAHFLGVPARGNDRFCGDLTAIIALVHVSKKFLQTHACCDVVNWYGVNNIFANKWNCGKRFGALLYYLRSFSFLQ